MNKIKVSIKDYKFYIEKKLLILINDLNFYNNSINTIIGPSGVGKSMFLKTLNKINELYKECSYTGSILLDNIDINSINSILLRQRIGIVFQKPILFPHLNIKENILLPLFIHKSSYKKKSIIKNSEETLVNSLKYVNLWNDLKDRLDDSSHKLSGGQIQRICIARAIVSNVEVLLLDEPCSSLDVFSISIINDLLCTLKEKMSIILVTHNLKQAQDISDYCTFLSVNKNDSYTTVIESSNSLFTNPIHQMTKDYISNEN